VIVALVAAYIASRPQPPAVVQSLHRNVQTSAQVFPLAGFAFMGKATDDPALAVTAEDTAIADDLDFFDEP
jgi:hypothetical protein